MEDDFNDLSGMFPTLEGFAVLSEDQIKYMVQRFLGWKLPANFNPDAGISFQPEFNKEYMARQGKPPMRHEPTGTNLFDATQAEKMVRYMAEGMPAAITKSQQ